MFVSRASAAAEPRCARGLQLKLPLKSKTAASSSCELDGVSQSSSLPLPLPLPLGNLYSLWPVDTENIGAQGCL